MNYILNTIVEYIPKPIVYLFEGEEVIEEIPKVNYKNFSSSISTTVNPIKSKKKRLFRHLEFADQGYFEHLKDSLYYSASSLKSALFFAIHGFYPDLFQHSGSDNTVKLADTIVEKYSNILNNTNNQL